MFVECGRGGGGHTMGGGGGGLRRGDAAPYIRVVRMHYTIFSLETCRTESKISKNLDPNFPDFQNFQNGPT